MTGDDVLIAIDRAVNKVSQEAADIILAVDNLVGICIDPSDDNIFAPINRLILKLDDKYDI